VEQFVEEMREKPESFLGRFPMGSLTESFQLHSFSGVSSVSNSYLLWVRAVSA